MKHSSDTANIRATPNAEQILTRLPAGVVVLDDRGYVQLSNPSADEMLGAPVLGMRWRDVIARSFAPRSDDGHEISLRDGRRVSIATCALDAGIAQLLLLKDITETRLLQERLTHRERLAAMGEMATCLAHQIRTPLTAALLYAAQLARVDLADQERQRFAAKQQARLQHLERLVGDMLTFARQGSLDREPLALEPLLREFQQAMETSLTAAGARLKFIEPLADIWVNGNRDALLTALQNLVDNALQAKGRGCQLTLALLLGEERSCDIVLTDNGPGIPQELQERVFEPFFTNRANGTGLGLAVVQAIAKAHEGAVWVDSQPGEGCRFSLRLPLAPSAAGGRRKRSLGRLR